MKSRLLILLLGFWVEILFAGSPDQDFILKSPDGKDEMHFYCSDWDARNEKACTIKSTKFIVNDLHVKSQFSRWAEQLVGGNDSLRNALCKNLQLIEPRVKESKEIVDLLRESCARADAKGLAAAYFKMDTLSKYTCLILNREENVTFAKGDSGTWNYAGRKINACIDEKRYRIKSEVGKKTLDKSFVYSGLPGAACEEEKYIEKNSMLTQLTDAHIEIPAQCHYLYLK